ncbi:MAG TPA: excinuclease ABC subunit A, partial [bacterium]|nr:excinuclease ABC subunit A [bacterium]
GGEAQRLKIARELGRRETGRTLYLLDEPTTGLHFEDIERLLHVLGQLVAGGNSVLVIEHHLEMIKCADYVVDLGPEGGEQGGQLLFQGPPEELLQHGESSYTAKYLQPYLAARPPGARPGARSKGRILA